MRFLRIFLALFVFTTVAAPSQGAVCRVATGMHGAMAAMSHHGGPGVKSCNGPAPMPGQPAPAPWLDCHVPGACHFGGVALPSSSINVAMGPVVHPQPPSSPVFPSIILPPPIKPPRA